MIAWLPELVYLRDGFAANRALVCDPAGTIVKIVEAADITVERKINLPRRALLPGMVNAHSHAFQRVLRGRTEYRTHPKSLDSFWTWREMMYSAATRLTPDDVYDASRMAFLEMALSGITAVGEFHYLHNAPEGTSYDDSNLLAKEVMHAAGEVGLRIALLRVAYARSGFQTEPNPKQARFVESSADAYLRNLEGLIASVSRGSVAQDSEALADDRANTPQAAWVGVAPHSVRAVPLDDLREVIAYANEND